jgi:hypothetical protein
MDQAQISMFIQVATTFVAVTASWFSLKSDIAVIKARMDHMAAMISGVEKKAEADLEKAKNHRESMCIERHNGRK